MDIITQRFKLKDIFPDRFKTLKKEYDLEDETEYIIKGIVPSDLKVEEEEHAIISYITTHTVDRDREIISPKGVNAKEYLKNPVVLWGHDYYSRALPLGRNLWLKSDDKGIIAKTQYYIKDEFAKKVYEYRKDGFPLAESIGFIPLEWKDLSGDESVKADGARRIYTKILLLEYSDVVIPSNPDAIGIARSKGLLKEEENPHLPEDYKKELEGVKMADEKSKDKKEEVKEEKDKQDKVFDTEEIYKIIKESIEIKEDNALLKVEKEELLKKMEELKIKAGAVLNKKNKDKLAKIKTLADEVLESAAKEEVEESPEGNTEEKTTYNCECIKCGHKVTVKKHCKDVICSECGGEMRREERPGAGKEIEIDLSEIDFKQIVVDTIKKGVSAKEIKKRVDDKIDLLKGIVI